MAIVEIISEVTRWAQHNICDNVKLKLPNDNKVDASYNENYRLVNPSAFSLFVPAKDRLPPKAIAPIPSLCVQLIGGRDTIPDQKGNMKLQFTFSAWDPGLHGPDIFIPRSESLPPLKPPQVYEQFSGIEAMNFYQRRSDGWKDTWNFVDRALQVLESKEYINGYRVMSELGIDYGPIAEEDSIPDFYPYWFAWLSFSLQYTVIRNNQEFQKFL